MSKEVRNFNRRYAKEYNIFRSIFYMSFLYIVVFGFFNIFYNYKIVGRENIPKSKDGNDKYIYAANHVSIFDPPMVVMAALRPVAFMAKKELFEPTEKLSWLVKRLGAFAVDRDKVDVSTIKTALALQKTNWNLGLFPQGTRCNNGKMENIMKGFASIAKKMKRDVLPVAIVIKDSKDSKRKEFIVKAGVPISFSDEDLINKWAKTVCELANLEYIPS